LTSQDKVGQQRTSRVLLTQGSQLSSHDTLRCASKPVMTRMINEGDVKLTGIPQTESILNEYFIGAHVWLIKHPHKT
jgi:hypothetical protein